MGCLSVAFWIAIVGSLVAFTGLVLNFVMGGKGPIVMVFVGVVMFLVAIIAAKIAEENPSSSFYFWHVSHVMLELTILFLQPGHKPLLLTHPHRPMPRCFTHRNQIQCTSRPHNQTKSQGDRTRTLLYPLRGSIQKPVFWRFCISYEIWVITI